MSRRQNLANTIRFFVQRVPNASPTQLVKFLYLADLESRAYLGRPVTGLDWIWWDLGPFDSEVLYQIDRLCEDKQLACEAIALSDGKNGVFYRAIEPCDPSVFRPEEAAILESVFQHYGAIPLRDFLEDVVCQTEPMIEAKRLGTPGCRLRMEMVDGSKAVPGLELGRMYAAIQELESGGGKNLDAIKSKIAS